MDYVMSDAMELFLETKNIFAHFFPSIQNNKKSSHIWKNHFFQHYKMKYDITNSGNANLDFHILKDLNIFHILKIFTFFMPEKIKEKHFFNFKKQQKTNTNVFSALLFAPSPWGSYIQR